MVVPETNMISLANCDLPFWLKLIVYRIQPRTTSFYMEKD